MSRIGDEGRRRVTGMGLCPATRCLQGNCLPTARRSAAGEGERTRAKDGRQAALDVGTLVTAEEKGFGSERSNYNQRSGIVETTRQNVSVESISRMGHAAATAGEWIPDSAYSLELTCTKRSP